MPYDLLCLWHHATAPKYRTYESYVAWCQRAHAVPMAFKLWLFEVTRIPESGQVTVPPPQRRGWRPTLYSRLRALESIQREFADAT